VKPTNAHTNAPPAAITAPFAIRFASGIMFAGRVVWPNAKLTDSEERAKGVRLETCG